MVFMKFENINIPVAIVIASAIIGTSFFMVESGKQKSIEKQQMLKIEQEERSENVKIDLQKKEYIVKRKKDCYELERTERIKWNNVDSSSYDDEKDVCNVSYENKNWRQGDPIFAGWDDVAKKYNEGKYFTKSF